MSEGRGSDRPRRYCTNCGAEVRPNNAFCSSCGAGLGETEGGRTSASPGPPTTAAWRPGVGGAPKQVTGRSALFAVGALLFLVAAWLLGILPTPGVLLTGLLVIAGTAAWGIRVAQGTGSDRPRGATSFGLLAVFGALSVLGLIVVVVIAYPWEPEYEVHYRRDISELLQIASGNDYGDTGVLDEEGTALYLQVEVQDADDIRAVEEQIASDFPAYSCIAIDYYAQGGNRPVEVSYVGSQSCGDDIELIEDFTGPLGRL